MSNAAYSDLCLHSRSAADTLPVFAASSLLLLFTWTVATSLTGRVVRQGRLFTACAHLSQNTLRYRSL